MSRAARDVLLRLLVRAERGGKRVPVLPVTPRYAPEYFEATGLDARDALHATLENAGAAGAVTLEWGRFEAEQDLQRIRLVDADRLALFLGVERAGAKAARIQRRVGPVLEGAPDWLSVAFRQALARWRKGDRAMGCGPDDAEAIEQLFRVAVAVHRSEHEGLDLRRFSTRLLGDSKAIERLRGRLASLLRHDPALADLEDDELFHALGLEKFPPPLFVRGALRMRYGGARMDLSALRPYVALSPDAVDDIVLANTPAYMLTIENLASFQRHVREIEDHGLVLYTGGFPGPAFRVILARLDRLVDETVPFFHWGDMDLGGLRIFKHLAGFVQRPLAPHLMEPPAGQLASRPFTPDERRRLEAYARDEGPAAALAASWLAAGVGCLEQEALDPATPRGAMDEQTVG